MSVRLMGPGRPDPMGVRLLTGGADGPDSIANVAVFSANATAVELCVFAGPSPRHRIALHGPDGGVWHGRVAGLRPGMRYAFRVHGPADPDGERLLVDPYARAITGSDEAPRAVIVAERPPLEPSRETSGPLVSWPDTVLYEVHVGGFTRRQPRIPPELRGTYAGMGHPAAIDHLRELGITSVELLPVHHRVTEPSVAARGWTNYWGYNTLGFFAPDARFAANGTNGEQVDEFRTMVSALHAAGIEVILDVVYNHTAEGRGDSAADGRTLSFRGFDDETYYRHDPGDPSRIVDFTGCGNTLDVRRPPVLRMVMDSLRYWVRIMGVDGFRFDLATALARDGGESGEEFRTHSAFLSAVHQDPVLRSAKLIAEPWDLGPDGYQVGAFGPPWSEWNGRYRDTVRDFWRGAGGGLSDLGSRISGSSDVYAGSGRGPYASVNFVTAHDGFTLADLVAYERKHNEANGEDNRDGTDDNRSANHGVEGPTDDPVIRATRRRQVRNLLTTLILSAGVPMLAHGDEIGRTQGGNNNAYCQDNEIAWVDWDFDAEAADLLRFTSALIVLRRRSNAFPPPWFFEGSPSVGELADLEWLRPDGERMTAADWHDPASRTIGVFLTDADAGAGYLLWLHAGAEDLGVTLPGKPFATEKSGHQNAYTVVFDTAADDPFAIDSTFSAGDRLTLVNRSSVLLRTVLP